MLVGIEIVTIGNLSTTTPRRLILNEVGIQNSFLFVFIDIIKYNRVVNLILFIKARNQNITVGVSFGATRELAFLNANNGTKIYFPQTNGMLFSFGRDVNINWKHGINALPEDEQDGKGTSPL